MTLPVVIAFGAFLFFGETFQAYELAGALVSLFAIWRVAVGKNRGDGEYVRKIERAVWRAVGIPVHKNE
jgi:hypothetical protein